MVEYREETEQDLDFLKQLYATTREQELMLVDWPLSKKEWFIDFQFTAQRTHYKKYYEKATFEVVMVDGQDAGRLYLEEREDELRIIDICLMPKYRGKGYGGYMMKQILEQGKTIKKPVRLSVEFNNPALGLYQKLGFKEHSQKHPYIIMEFPIQD